MTPLLSFSCRSAAEAVSKSRLMWGTVLLVIVPSLDPKRLSMSLELIVREKTSSQVYAEQSMRAVSNPDNEQILPYVSSALKWTFTGQRLTWIAYTYPLQNPYIPQYYVLHIDLRTSAILISFFDSQYYALRGHQYFWLMLDYPGGLPLVNSQRGFPE